MLPNKPKEECSLSCRRRAFGTMKKRTKKRLSVWVSGAPAVVRTQATDKSFLLLFFKKEALAFLC
jgi:hypothetical protein